MLLAVTVCIIKSMAKAVRNYWSRLREFFRDHKQVVWGVFIFLLFCFVFMYVTVSRLSGTHVREISGLYYANVPTTDSVTLVIPGMVPPWVPPVSLVESDHGAALTVKRRGNLLMVAPESGRWPKGRTMTLNIRRPWGLFSTIAAYLSPRGFGPWKTFVTSVTFVTSGTFGLLESRTPELTNPHSGIELRFNEHLKNPSDLASFVAVKGVASVAAVMKESNDPSENNLVYLISSPQFAYNKSYELTIKRGFTALTGEVFDSDVVHPFRTTKNPTAPSVNFGKEQVSERLIVRPDDGKTKPVLLQYKNVGEVSLSLYKASAADAINYLIYEQGDDRWSKESSYSARTTGMAKLWTEKIADPKNGEIQLPAHLGAGVYLLEARVDDGDEPIRSYVYVNVTNIGAVARVGATRIAVWAANVINGEGVGGASVRLYKLKDGANIQTTGTSDGQGLAMIENPGESDLGVVFKDNDVAFVPLLVPGGHIGRAGDTPDYEGFWGSYPAPTDTTKSYLTTDRPIYQPGDTIHYKAIIRSDQDAQYHLPESGEYTIAVINNYWSQEEKPLMSATATSGEYGTVWGDLTISEEFKPGNYYLSVKKGTKNLMTLGFVVAEYRKPLYHLEVTSKKPTVGSGETLEATVHGTFSFGAPLKDKSVSWMLYSDPSYGSTNGTVDPYAERSAWWGDAGWWYDMYDYHDKSVQSGTVTLNANGDGIISVPIDTILFEKLRDRKFTIRVEISESGIEPENAQATVRYDPSGMDLFVSASNTKKGAASMTTRIVDNTNNPVPGVSVMMSGKGLTKEETKTSDSKGLIVWDMNGKFSKERGSSDLKLTWKDSKGRSEEMQTTFWEYYYYPDGQQATSQAYVTDATLTFPDTVKHGESVNMTVSKGGKLHLVTVERGDVIEAFVVERDIQSSVKISDGFMPNAYLSTYSFIDGKLAMTYREVRPADLADYRHVSLLVTPDKPGYGPGDRAVFTVETKDRNGQGIPAEVNITVVDKSIYDLKKSAIKPIHPEFYRRRGDTTVYGLSLVGIWEWSGGGRGGGGGGEGAAREVFADTAFNKPDVTTDENGRATVEFTLPDNLTTWVTDAYAVTRDTSVGDMHGEFIVSRPVFVLPVYSSFITEGDDIGFGAIVGNTSGASQTIKTSFAFDSKAPVKNPTQTSTLGDGSTAFLRWQYRVSGGSETGSASLVATTKENGPLDAVNMNIPVHRQGKTVTSRVSGIGAKTVSPQILPGADGAKSRAFLTVTTGVLGYISELLTYQAGYPYGCVEQTMSRFYPTLLVSNNLSELTITDPALLKNLPDMVTKGLDRLKKFQHSDGGWGLWENDDSSIFNTGYVVSGLVDLGDRAPGDMLANARKFLENAASKDLKPGESVVVLSALTKLKSPVVASTVADKLSKTGLDKLDDAELAQGAIALADIKHASGNDFFKELVKRAQPVGSEEVRWKSGNSYEYHPHENLTIAFALQSLLKSDPENPMIVKAINYLNNHRNMNQYGSTYANAQVVKAFIAYSKRYHGNNPDYTLSVSQGGKEKLREDVRSVNQVIGPITIDGTKPVDIKQSGTGTLLWDIRVDNVFGALTDNRMSPDIALTRSYTNVSRPRSDIRVGDLVEITLQVKNNSSRDLHDVAVDDSLPAGFEAINTLLDNQKKSYTRGENYRWPWYATEIHADRVVIFPYVIGPGKTENITYIARAYMPGTFTANPASAVMMYEPGIPALTKSEKIKISDF